MRLSSEHLDLIVKIVDKGSFSSAARALNKTPSAVSMAIANIEAELGLCLFERSTSSLIPTGITLSIEPQARQILSKIAHLQSHVNELSIGLEPVLKIGIASDVNIELIMPAMNEISKRYPLINIELKSSPQQKTKEMLHKKEIDLCISYNEAVINKDEQFQLIALEKIIATIASNHPFSKESVEGKNLVSLSEVRQIVVGTKKFPQDSRMLLSDSLWFSDNLPMAIYLVERGMGWGNFPLSVVESFLSKGSLQKVKFSNTFNGLDMPVNISWMRGKPLNKAAFEFVEQLSLSHQ